MDLVDDNNSEAALDRTILDAFGEIPDVVNPSVRSAVNLQHIERVAGGDLEAIAAGVAGVRGRTLFAVERFGKQASHGSLPDPTRAGEEKGVGDAAAPDGVTQGAGHVFLADYVSEGLRSPLAGEDKIAHGILRTQNVKRKT